jgi:hypothetical protein
MVLRTTTWNHIINGRELVVDPIFASTIARGVSIIGWYH